ncbi:MAG: DUF305 domain-containing protein [Candidatus Woesearchaeota archaeon]
MNIYNIVIISLAMLLSACGAHVVNHSDMMDMQDHTITSEEQFIIEMMPHHQEAIDVSINLREYMNEQNITHQQVMDLLHDIIETQYQEMQLMQSFIDTWYNESTYTAQYEKMMSYESEIDIQTYLEEMIQHHKMAVMMAQQVIELDVRAEVQQLAESIIDAQQEEIELMQSLLE